MRALGMAVSLCLGLAIVSSSAVARSSTVEGTLVDAKCYLSDSANIGNDHKVEGADMKECGTMCLKMGLPAAVVTANNEVHNLIAPSLQLANYVGETVRVSGMTKGDNIIAEKVEVRKNGQWEEVKIGTMM